MAKQVRSVRFDKELIDLYNSYAAYEKEVFGTERSLSSYANEALAFYFEDHISFMYNAISSNSIVERTPDGRLFKRTFTEDQVRRLEEIMNEACATYYSIAMVDKEGN